MKDFTTWAYSHFMTVILLALATSKEEVAGLAVHKYLVIQLAQDLETHHWLLYDKFQAADKSNKDESSPGSGIPMFEMEPKKLPMCKQNLEEVIVIHTTGQLSLCDRDGVPLIILQPDTLCVYAGKLY